MATHLADRHEVRVFDTNIADQPIEDAASEAEQFAPDVVGISLRNIDNQGIPVPILYYKKFRPLLQALRAKAPNAAFIAGGPGFSLYAEQVMRDAAELDFGVFLEGERTMPELIDRLGAPQDVPGVYYRENGEPRLAGWRDPLDFSLSAAPRRDFLPLAHYTRGILAMGLQTKRGCGRRCLYCAYPKLEGQHVRARPPEQVVDEIEELKRTGYPCKNLMFVDAEFNQPRKHAEEICRELVRRKLNVKWSACFGEKGFDESLGRLAVEAGCRRFIFSPDGYSQPTLDALQKDITTADVRRSLTVVKAMPRASASYSFFANPPGQTPAGLLRLCAFAARAKLALGRRLALFGLNDLWIEPHTDLHGKAVGQGAAPKTLELSPLRYQNPDRSRIVEMLVRLGRALGGVRRLLTKGRRRPGSHG